MQQLTVVMAQCDPIVGDIQANTEHAYQLIQEACIEHKADIVVFPELFLIGYSPEDLLLRPALESRIEVARTELAQRAPSDVMVIIGYPGVREHALRNLAGVLLNGEWIAEYAKQALPNYGVFDEKRYFTEGNTPCVVEYKGLKVGLAICEDVWSPQPVASYAGTIDLLLSLNCSPWHVGKQAQRFSVVKSRAQELGVPVAYVHQVGGQDDLVFDGASFVVDAEGELCVQAPAWEEGVMPFGIQHDSEAWHIQAGALGSLPDEVPKDEFSEEAIAEIPQDEEAIYCALMVGLREYVRKSGFEGIVLGLSGGIDSALSLAIAVDALGADRVRAIMMPYHYTADISRNDAKEEADLLGVDYDELPIVDAVEALKATLAPGFDSLGAASSDDVTEQNLQARVRGTLLMAEANRRRLMVLTTGNKSEMAVGYATLYGDMVGGYSVLKDVYKTEVFRLAKWRNEQEAPDVVIPPRVIERPPSAELAEGQQDSDSLPDYALLDAILIRYIEQDQSIDDIIEAGFDADSVRKVVRLVDRNEFKRRQSAPGVRITSRAFGRERRYPIVNGWR